MSTQTVEVALTLNAHVVNVPLASAQSALLAELKAAGNDLGALLYLVLGHLNSNLSEQGLCW